MITPSADILRRYGADIEWLRRPMSHPARELIDTMIAHMATNSMATGATFVAMVKAFALEFDPLVYETAGSTFDVKVVANLVNMLPATKKKEDILARMSLSGLFDGEWERTQKKSTSKIALEKKVGSIQVMSIPEVRPVYDYLTTRYLLDDFTQSELRRIVDMATRCKLERIKAACQQIQDPTKRTIAYLFKVVESEERERKAQAKEMDRIYKESAVKIKMMLDIVNTPNPVKWSKEEMTQWLEDMHERVRIHEMDKAMERDAQRILEECEQRRAREIEREEAIKREMERRIMAFDEEEG